jgi:uncharacterized protein with GYD domain
MKYVLLGTLSADWASQQERRIKKARDKLAELGIKLESVYYTQGQFDFVDVVDAPTPESMLAFSVWYTTQGLGKLQTMPAFDMNGFVAAARKALKDRGSSVKRRRAAAARK